MAEVNRTDNRETTSLRVNIGLLDNLMNLAGELVLGRNQLLQALGVNDEKTLHLTSQRIDLVTSELQEGIMKTRMQPIANIFNNFPRMIRDLNKSSGKTAKLEVEGQDVELDKTIIEVIGDPLAQLVCNAASHGIEPPDVRKQKSKPVDGCIRLKAFHEAGQVNIEISDDGCGLSPDDLAATAQQKGLISTAQSDAMPAKDKLQLIFLPGFTTAKPGTGASEGALSMDEVKSSFEKLGGVIDLASETGRGTAFRIKLPLTLAIIPSQIISVGGERYAIPQVNLDELLRIPANQVKDKIEKVGDAAVIRLRGKLLPLIRVADVLGIQRVYTHIEEGNLYPDRRQNIADPRVTCIENGTPSESQPEDRDRAFVENRTGTDRRYHSSSSLNIAVVSAGALTYGLIVDQMHDSEEIVVKPLGRHLNDCAMYAGATIMGDGRVALILDVYNLAKKGQLNLTVEQHRTTQTGKDTPQNQVVSGKVTRWLLFRIAEDEHFAIALDCVERIERIIIEEIEEVGGKKVLQNRGSTLPLIFLDEVATIKPMAEKTLVEVITVRVADRMIGLLATPPVDAVELSIEIDDTSLRQDCILGSAIIREHTTLIVDIGTAVKRIYPDLFYDHEAA